MSVKFNVCVCVREREMAAGQCQVQGLLCISVCVFMGVCASLVGGHVVG